MKLVWGLLIFFMIACSALAAPTATHLATSGNTADQSSYITGSVNTTGADLDLAWIYSSAATTPNIPSISGVLNWVVADTIVDTDGTRRLTLLRAMNPNPTSGTHTISFGGQTQTGCTWSISEYDGVNTTGWDGSAAVIQTAKSSASIGLSLSLNLNPFNPPDNSTAVGIGMANAIGGLPPVDSGYVLLGRQNQGSPALTVMTEYGAAANPILSLGVVLVPTVGISVEFANAVAPKKYGLPIIGSGN